MAPVYHFDFRGWITLSCSAGSIFKKINTISEVLFHLNHLEPTFFLNTLGDSRVRYVNKAQFKT